MNSENSDPEAVNVDDLECRVNQLQGVPGTSKAQTFNVESLSEEEQISRLMEKCMEEARIDRMASIVVNDDDQMFDADSVDHNENQWCFVCCDDTYIICKTCEEPFCKKCFEKSHKKKEFKKHETILYERSKQKLA